MAPASRPAPPALTGDAGGGFEVQVGAYCMVHLLRADLGFGDDLGMLNRVRFQAKDLDSCLDDLELHFQAKGNSFRKLNISVKRNRQVTSNGFAAEFVKLAWQEWDKAQGESGSTIPTFLMLAVGELAGDVESAWHDMSQEIVAAADDDARLVSRFTSANVSSSIKRRLFDSLHGPDSKLQNSAPEQTVRFIRSLRLKLFDFRDITSRDRSRGIELCRSALLPGDLPEAQRLWEKLVSIAHAKRQKGGTVDLRELLALLTDFRLKDHPNYELDWKQLLAHSNENISDIQNDVGGKASLIRRNVLDEVKAAFTSHKCVVLSGESGCGKSGIAKILASKAQRVVWLLPDDFNSHNLPSIEQRIQLKNALNDVLLSATSPTALLVIDGAERLRPGAVRNLSILIGRLLSAESPWRILVTAQAERWDDLCEQFSNNDLPTQNWRVVPCELPDKEETRILLRMVPQLENAGVRPEVERFLRNPKTIDWILRATDRSTTIDTSNWIGVTDVIEWIWSGWINGNSKIEKAALLKRLAAIDAESLTTGIKMSSIHSHELQTLKDLISLKLLRTRDERVFLEHDLLGDWARVLILVEDDSPKAQFLSEKAGRARWHRAVRLYGQRLLEHDPSKQAWQRIVTAWANPSGLDIIARDLLMESAVCAVNASTLLEQFWALLADKKGILLRSLLVRFLHFSTKPNPNYVALAQNPTNRFWLASQQRVVKAPYAHWCSMIGLLHLHRSELAKIAPGLAAQVCQMWLLSMPSTNGGKPFPLRLECAAISLAIARKFQALKAENKYFHHDDEEKVLTAALLAAGDMPIEATQFALELACRRPLSPDIAKIKEADGPAERVSSSVGLSTTALSWRRNGPIRDPWEDGPSDRVDRLFQKVCLDPFTLQPLMQTNPEVAKEIVLATCIEEPKPSWVDSHDLMDEHLCLEWHHEWTGSMYFNGPFLQFLRINPKHGISLIVRLVNFATDRHVEWLTQVESNETGNSSVSHLSVTMLTAKGKKAFHGDSRIYGWHRDHFVNSQTLVSALMALEKWLYEELEAKTDISEWIAIILSESRSVAILGVLVTVAKSAPILLQSSLKPLLSVWQLFGWDMELAIHEGVTRIGLSSWIRDGERMFNVVRDWSFLMHRRQYLLSYAIPLVLVRDFQQFFHSVRTEWDHELESAADSDSLRLLIARFDPANYQTRRVDESQVEVRLELPPTLKADCEATEEDARENIALLNFPVKCRQIIDDWMPLDDGHLLEHYGQFNKFAAMDAHQERVANAIAGGVAVLILLHWEWVESDENRERECGAMLERILKSPPANSGFDCRESIVNYGWDCFIGEILIASLARESSNVECRCLTAGFITGFHYQTTLLMFRVAYRLRSKLGLDFFRLQNLAILYSGISHVSRFAEDRQIRGDHKGLRLLNRLHNRLVQSFSDQSLSSTPIAWREISDRAYDLRQQLWLSLFKKDKSDIRETVGSAANMASATDTNRRKVRRKPLGLDLQYIQHAFEWLPSLDDSISSQERTNCIDLTSRLLDLTIWSILASAGSRRR